MTEPVRAAREDERTAPRPLYVVWELTLKCDQACHHCGSRAGHARAVELSKGEALEVARQLARVGVREVVLIGGDFQGMDDVHTTPYYGRLFTGSRGMMAGAEVQA